MENFFWFGVGGLLVSIFLSVGAGSVFSWVKDRIVVYFFSRSKKISLNYMRDDIYNIREEIKNLSKRLSKVEEDIFIFKVPKRIQDFEEENTK